MQRRTLGTNGLDVSAQGRGCMGMSAFYSGRDDAESTATLERAAKVHPIAAVQTEYSLWSRDPEDGVLAACRRLGIGFVAYSPLGRGFLTGQIKRYEDLGEDDYRRHSASFQGDNFRPCVEARADLTPAAARPSP
jgi:aryl-alcohol dehydrogenase-like predicted oxidoreductase